MKRGKKYKYLSGLFLILLFSCGKDKSGESLFIETGSINSKKVDNTENTSDSVVVELFAEKFKWTIRYSGENNILGEASYQLINEVNPLGVLTSVNLKKRIFEIEDSIQQLEKFFEPPTNDLTDLEKSIFAQKLQKMNRIHASILLMKDTASDNLSHHDENAQDDIIVTSEIHLKVNQEYFFILRSKDVIHSAYFPHFRAQMNVVPGMATRLKLKPSITTDSMRMIENNPEFDYVLACNKICGVGHYKMKMKIVVDSPEDYYRWIKRQKTYGLGK